MGVAVRIGRARSSPCQGARAGPAHERRGWGIIRAMSTTTSPASSSIPPRSELRHRVLAGEPTVGLFVTLGSVVAADMVGRAGFDWAVLDLEHGMGSEADLLAQLLAVQGTPTTAIVRVPSAERLRVGRALDMGSDGLMIPRLETVAEVTETISWMRYPPAGMRGIATSTRGAGYGALAHAQIHEVNERVLGVFQVESMAAVEVAGDVAAIDGVDVLFVGPTDLSHSMGIPGEIEDPSFVAALDRVVAACVAHGKAAGILLRDAAALPAALEQGFRFVGVGSDSGFLLAGIRGSAREALAAVR